MHAQHAVTITTTTTSTTPTATAAAVIAADGIQPRHHTVRLASATDLQTKTLTIKKAVAHWYCSTKNFQPCL